MNAKETVSKKLNEKMFVTYRETNKLGITPYIFGVPFSLGSIGMLVWSINMFLNGEIMGGLFILLIAVPPFALIAYFFGIFMIVEYIVFVKAIKNENYVLKRAICNKNSITKKNRYHDSSDLEDYSNLVFINEEGEYKVCRWGRFTNIVPDHTYLLVFLRSDKTIAFICDEENERVIPVNNIF